jgi:hypothetical protein
MHSPFICNVTPEKSARRKERTMADAEKVDNVFVFI